MLLPKPPLVELNLVNTCLLHRLILDHVGDLRKNHRFDSESIAQRDIKCEGSDIIVNLDESTSFDDVIS